MPNFPMQGMPIQGMPRQSYPTQGMPQGMPVQQGMPMPPPSGMPQMGSAQPTPWQVPSRQATPSLAYVAGGKDMPPPPPSAVRGVAPEFAPAPAKAPVRFVLPSPEELGVATTLKMPNQTATAVQVDWNQVHVRMEKLGVLRYEKERLPNGNVRVILLLPMADPTRAQPVEAIAETEGIAILGALQRSEAWMRER